MRTSRSCFAFLAVLSILVGLSAPITAQDATPAAEGITILPPDESYGGATRGEWDARSWQWSISFPQDISPGLDSTGERCGYGQVAPVFFLPGSYTGDSGPITCVVPEGAAIFVTVGTSECSTVEPPPFFGRNEEELRACAQASSDAFTELEATINGETVPNLEDYRSSSPAFPLIFSRDDAFGAPAGVALSVAEGYNFIIPPLPPGEYEIIVSVVFEPGMEPASFTYRVLVESPNVIEPAATPGDATPVS